MSNDPTIHLETLEALIQRRICTSVIVSTPEVATWIDASTISTGQGRHVYGDALRFADGDVEISQFDEVSGEILLVLTGIGPVSITIVPQDVDAVIL